MNVSGTTDQLRANIPANPCWTSHNTDESYCESRTSTWLGNRSLDAAGLHQFASIRLKEVFGYFKWLLKIHSFGHRDLVTFALTRLFTNGITYLLFTEVCIRRNALLVYFVTENIVRGPISPVALDSDFINIPFRFLNKNNYSEQNSQCSLRYC